MSGIQQIPGMHAHKEIRIFLLKSGQRLIDGQDVALCVDPESGGALDGLDIQDMGDRDPVHIPVRRLDGHVLVRFPESAHRLKYILGVNGINDVPIVVRPCVADVQTDNLRLVPGAVGGLYFLVVPGIVQALIVHIRAAAGIARADIIVEQDFFHMVRGGYAHNLDVAHDKGEVVFLGRKRL